MNPRTLSGSRPPLAKTTAIYGMMIAPTAGYGGQPPQVVDEHEDGDDEAEQPDAHHEQVAVLPVPDVLGHRPPRLGDQVHLLALSGVPSLLTYPTDGIAYRGRYPGQLQVSSPG